jgi:hypothetical protein
MSASDTVEIINLLNLYGLAVDTLQWDLFDLIFAPDADVRYPGGSHYKDLETLKQSFERAHRPLDSSQHMVTNHVVTVDRDRAHALSYARARLIRGGADGGVNWWEIGAWYDDGLARTAAGWRIVRRRCLANWWDGNPQVQQFGDGPTARLGVQRLRGEAALDRIEFIQALRRRAADAKPA